MNRKDQLTRRFLDILKGSTDVERHKALFLEGIHVQDDPAACVSNIVHSRHGLPAVHKAMCHDLSVKFMNGLGSTVIRYLLRAEDLGDVLDTVLLAIIDPPIFWDKFCDEFEKGHLDKIAESTFAHLLAHLLRMENKHASLYRDRAKQPLIFTRLINSDEPEVKAAANLIREILSTTSITSATSMPEGPGGRHDNDFINFREISIVPTSNEILCTKKAFFRHAAFLEDPSAKETRIADYLDNTFRLLREDMLYELKDDLQPVLIKNTKKRAPRGTVIEGLSIAGVFTGTGDQRTRTRHGIVLRCSADLKIFQNVKEGDRKNFLKTDPRGTKFLSNQSLACLIVDGELLALGTILRVEDLLAAKRPAVVIQICGESSFIKTVLRLNAVKEVKLIQTNTGIFAFEPVLRVLQTMTVVPLAEEILFWENGIPIRSPSVTVPKITFPLSRNLSMDIQPLLGTPTSIKLDSAQAESLLAGLNQRVALIQGPPGTGKSFIGALLAKALHDFTDQTILVVCYTNHALDQFLEDLLKIGIPESSVVRLGGRANAAISQLSLRNQSKERYHRSQAEWSIIDRLKARAEFLSEKLEEKFTTFLSSGISLEDMLVYVEFEDPDYFAAFQVPDPDSEHADGMITVGKDGKAIDGTYLISRWSKGQDAGIFEQDPNIVINAAIWSMPSPRRQQKLADWQSAIDRSMVDDIWKRARDFDDCQDELSRKFGASDVELLKQKRVIGCTTTGAAKYTEDIKAALPGVLLVEEAGEILESHVITALGKNTSQMILIGDHKQLRPKVNNYELTVEKREGYDLNRSLFERLVLKGFPHVTLTAQHRMRPEISALIRALTYPGLTDAPKTQNRANIRGIQSNIVFVDHGQHEDEDARITDRTDGGSQTSKRNQFEVDMVMKIVHYLIQQGYGSENIVLLTPYLGQLSALRDALKKDTDAIMNELDSRELTRAGLLPSSTMNSKNQKKRIRLATIDNYQGEESDIVVASLTRANSNGAIGFMNSPERLNVLVSRARDGLILVGNSQTFKSSKSGGAMWIKFFDLLQNGGHIYQGFPVKCEHHPQTTAVIKLPAEFDSFAPDGGCTQPCGSLLSCKIHTCSKKCHPLRLGPGQPDVHQTMPCNHIFTTPCPANTHQMKWKCSQSRPEKCMTCEKEMKRLEKQVLLALEAQEQREAQQRQHDMEMLELEAQLQLERDKEADIQAAKDMDDERRQKRKEIADAKKRAENTTKQAGARTAAAASGNANSDPSKSTSSTSSPQGGGIISASPRGSTSTPLRPSAPSPARDKWEHQKHVDGVQNDAIDNIMDLTGLEEVKEQILRIKAKIDTMKRQGVALNKERLNLVLLGNPGTGKTTVARLYAQFLESIQVLPGDAFLETTGSKLSSEGVGGAQKLINQALLVGGGAIFIDEAYQLTSESSGKQVLDFLLAEMENRVGTLIFVLAGYNKEMEKFFEHNPGLPSRVPYRLQFADYTDAELVIMLEDFVLKRYQGRMVVEDGIRGLYCRIAVRRLGRGRGIPGFGNARALQNMFAKVCERQAERVEKGRRAGAATNDFYMTKEDLIGPDPSQVIPNNAAWAELQGMIGLESVKESVRNFFALVETNYYRELEEKELLQTSLNRVFLGSPGTGKTTVAKLYGQVLADLHLLSNGEVVVKNPSDFVGAYLGHSEKNTKAILESTRGKVLVIDEAYMLHGGKSHGGADSFKTTVIDTIVAEIQSVPGEDRCVLLLGYKEQMEEMFQNVNPGLSRRFAIENAFNFEDFTEPQLMQILDYKLKKQDLTATDDAKQVARDLLSRMKDRPNFGNAGEVENILGLAKGRYQKRMSSVLPHLRSNVVFEPQDFDPDFNRSQNAPTNLAKLFEDVIGCDAVIQKLDKYQRIARTMKAQGLDMRTQIPNNFVFKGPPGTGKTTTARKLGQVYFDMGFLSSAEVIECSASDLVGQYVGHTGPKTRKLFDKALGKVLFIDEAYRLSQGQFAQEAMDEIVDIMTKEKFMNKLVIILAGYDDEMNKLLKVNPGLSSRFSEEIHFNNMTPEQCLALLDKDLGKSNIAITEMADQHSPQYQHMRVIIYRMSLLQSWGNARDIKTLGKRLFQQAYANASNGGSATLSVAEALNIMQTMLKEQRDRLGVPGTRPAPSPPPIVASLSGPPPPPPPTASSSSSQSSKPPPPPPPSSASKPPRQQPSGSGGPRGRPAQTPPRQQPARQQQRGNPARTRQPNLSDQTTQAKPSVRMVRSSPMSSLPHSAQPSPSQTSHSLPQTGMRNLQVERDPGLSDEVWNQLQVDKRAVEEQKRRAKEEESRLQRELKKRREAERRAEDRAKERAAAFERAKQDTNRALQERLQRELEAARQREAEEKAAMERALAELKQKQQEEARRKQREDEIAGKLKRSGRCPVGYRWVPQLGGWRCEGGSHFVRNDQLTYI